MSDQRLRVSLPGLDLKNPIIPASGCFGFGQEYAKYYDLDLLGSIMIKATTLDPRFGNPTPRVAETPAGMLNAIGLQNPGVEAVLAEKLPWLEKHYPDLPIIANVAGFSNQEYATVAGKISQAPNVKAIELNISCPNAGKEPFIEAEPLDALLTALDSVPRDVPFWVKMPHLYDIEQFDSLLKVIVRHNIQGVTVANLVKDRSKIDIKDPLTDEIRGGLSGEPTREHSLELIRHAYKKYGDRLTIIGVGGVFSAEDAYAKIKAGASLVGLITGLFFEGPQLIGQINRGLVELLKKDGFSHISEAVGADFRSEPKKAKKL